MGQTGGIRVFSGISDPFYTVSFRQDVTGLHAYTKANGLSFYLGMIWACTRAINRVEAFLYAVREGKAVLLDRRDPGFTDLRLGEDRFRILTLPYHPDIRAFCREASRLREEQKTFIDPDKESDALIYYSCFPWLDLTALTHERDLSAPGAPEDSIPRIAWGRVTQENERWTLCIPMEVNHRFIDGVHIGRFAQALEDCFRALEDGQP